VVGEAWTPYPVEEPSAEVLDQLPSYAGRVLDSGRARSSVGLDGELVVTSRGLVAFDLRSGQHAGIDWYEFDPDNDVAAGEGASTLRLHFPGYEPVEFTVDPRFASNIVALCPRDPAPGPLPTADALDPDTLDLGHRLDLGHQLDPDNQPHPQLDHRYEPEPDTFERPVDEFESPDAWDEEHEDGDPAASVEGVEGVEAELPTWVVLHEMDLQISPESAGHVHRSRFLAAAAAVTLVAAAAAWTLLVAAFDEARIDVAALSDTPVAGETDAWNAGEVQDPGSPPATDPVATTVQPLPLPTAASLSSTSPPPTADEPTVEDQAESTVTVTAAPSGPDSGHKRDSGAPTTTTTDPATSWFSLVSDPDACHPAYEGCIPFFPGDALDCADIADLGPIRLRLTGADPYILDIDEDGIGCELLH
jgi:hypothetical protein